MPVPPPAVGGLAAQQNNIAIGGGSESVVNMQPASMGRDEHVESPRVDEEENRQSEGEDEDVDE